MINTALRCGLLAPFRCARLRVVSSVRQRRLLVRDTPSELKLLPLIEFFCSNITYLDGLNQ